MIAIRNSWHGTNRELPDVNIGDIIPARLAQQVSLEMCGYIDCAKCGPLGEHGQQPGFVVVPMGDGSVFISPLDGDFKDIGQGHHQKNRSDRVSEGRFSDDDIESDEKQPPKPDPVAQSLGLLLELRNHAGDLPGRLSEWLEAGINNYLGGSKSFDQCLVLSQPVSGTVPANAMHQRTQRNQNLRQAAILLEPGGSDWGQAGALMTAIERFDIGELRPGSIHDHIRLAHETGLSIPGSQMGLHDILTKK